MSEFCIEEKMNEIDAAKMMADERVKDAVNNILVELVRAESLYPVWPLNDSVAMGIIEDQVIDAFFAGVQSEGRRRKVISTAAMCIRYLINLDVEK